MSAIDDYREIRETAMRDLVRDPRTVVYAADAALAQLEDENEQLRRQCLHEWVSFRVPVTQESEFYCARCDARKKGARITYPSLHPSLPKAQP